MDASRIGKPFEQSRGYAALYEAAKAVVWKLSHNHHLDDYKGPARIDRRDATIRQLMDAIAEAEGGQS